ncbi:hypothetical protein [Lactobacillus ultunensis]|uniref:DUF5673 domain-containing protein n=1 Tax=Lactobacillus ultunensis DSM 16047 TaxID=525365 RepID=C2EQ40_9LACO|nr:hypothetical protein [Lactobacillus ultunensis]EEJ71327.1 hypothetical protein HMPREF0548_1786 [Lactobacillus ultunensis DSM 16047]KRL81587.1 hypothetical protein FC57_GL000455 [Lactobacillus ultunensis DSM 16047]QQP28666.1 hypothetical protein H4B44_00710 [Lactobacillus ultunensis]
MTYMSYFYIVVNIIMLAYACYSWYWQAKVEFHGRYRISSIIWAIIFIWLGFTWNYIEKGDPGLNVFLALFLLISIVDGFSGFSAKRMVVSGYFKRTVKYDEIANITLINVPSQKKPLVMALFRTNNNRAYMMRFRIQVTEVLPALQKYIGKNIPVEIQS